MNPGTLEKTSGINNSTADTRIYLDNAATTAIDPQVLEAMMPYLSEKFGNPSAIYSYGRETRMAVEASRRLVAKLLHAAAEQVFFTGSGTESSNMAITAAVRDLQCRRIITSPLEHHAVLHTVDHMRRQYHLETQYVKLLPNGHIDLEDLESLLKYGKEKTLVTLMHANNEIGNLLDLQTTGMLCRKYGAVFHSDTVQTVGHLPFDLKNTPVDFITGSAHKFHGPKGVGILCINENIRVGALIHGGAQERNMRAGTENVYGIVGFAKALELATAGFEKDSGHITNLKAYMMMQLAEHIPGISFNGDTSGRSLYTVLSVNFPENKKTESLLLQLDRYNICVSGGSACTAGKASHVISALQKSAGQVTLRCSFSKYNTREEIDTVVGKLKELLN